MTDFSIKKLPYDLTSNAGLALAGQYLKRLKIDAALDRKFPYMDAPEFARLSIHDGLKVKIAPVHSDFECGLRRCP